MKVDKHGNLHNEKGLFAGKTAPPAKALKVDRLGNIHDSKGRFAGKASKAAKQPYVSNGVKNTNKKPRRKKVVNPTTKTHISFCLDYSCSMSCLITTMNQVVRNLLSEIKDNDVKFGQDSSVGVVGFGSYVKVLSRNKRVQDIVSLGLLNRTLGMTALFDGIRESINQLEDCNATEYMNQVVRNLLSDEEDSYLVYVLTDGLENHSVHKIYDTVEKIKSLQSTDRWTFVFMVPNTESMNVLIRYGIPEGNIRVWEQSEEGLEKVEALTTSSLTGYYQNRSMGVQSTSDFFGYKQC